MDVHRRLARAGLVIVAGAAALALWAGLTAAGADTAPVTGGKTSVVLTQTDSDNGGHRCHRDGSSGEEPTAPTSANSSSSV